MADSFKVLGQLNPVTAALSALYTVPSATEAVISTFVACNRSGAQSSFRLSVAVNGATDSSEQYLYYDVAVPGYDTFTASLGITLDATDELRVYAGLTTLSFSAFGMEIT